MRVWTFPFSTNAERVALALAFKGLDAEWVEIDPADRTPVRQLSGQDLVPVLEHDGRVITDSMRIVAHLEERFPDPPLYPADPARRAEMHVFIDWFNRVWKLGPNAIADGVGNPEEHALELRASLEIFETLLQSRDHLLDDAFTAADVCAFPFLKYGVARNQADDETFHLVLAEQLRLEPRHARLRDWIERVSHRL